MPTSNSSSPHSYRTQFDYLLNAFEEASQSSDPAEHAYGAKRESLFKYVRALEERSDGPVCEHTWSVRNGEPGRCMKCGLEADGSNASKDGKP